MTSKKKEILNMSEQFAAAAFADNSEPDGTNATLTSPITQYGRPAFSRRYVIPARQGRAVRLEQGHHLKIINTHGTQVCDMWAFHAHSLQEFLSMEHVRPWLNRMTPRIGDALVTNHRRPILTLLEDTSPGIHDTTIASCDIYRYYTLGVQGYHDNCADNLRMALQAIGMRVPEVPSPFNLWMNTPYASDGTLEWLPTVSKMGDYVVFQAELDCIVVMSACPQDLVPVNGKDCIPRNLHFEVS
jgi:uncharacterized protein YcgI (DUF1989 family)